jgi:segregation and condensation protein B
MRINWQRHFCTLHNRRENFYFIAGSSTDRNFYVRLSGKLAEIYVGKAVESRVFQGKMTSLQDSQDTHNTPTGRKTDNAEQIAHLVTAAESLLFVSGRPLEYTELRKLLDVDDTRLLLVLNTLAAQLEEQGRGVRLQRLESQVQLVTAPENARYIAALLGLPMTAKLTTAAMETLAVIAYRQPMTRAQIEAVRGVNSDRALASLIQHSLVAEVGRAQTVGRPALFATTPEFLQQFGLTHLRELPYVEQNSLAEPTTETEQSPEVVQPEMPGLDDSDETIGAVQSPNTVQPEILGPDESDVPAEIGQSLDKEQTEANSLDGSAE